MQELSRFQELIHSNDCVSDAVEFIWSSVSTGITERWLRTLELPIAIDMTLLKMNKIVGWSVMNHDGILSEDFLEVFVPECEPIPVSIDPWARGTVPMRKENPGIDFSFISSAKSSTPSVTSRRSSRSSLPRGAQSFTGGTNPEGSANDSEISGKIINLCEEPEFPDVDSTASMFKLLQKTKRLKLRDAKENAGEKVTEFETIQEEIGNAARDLKGKKFVVDKEGKLLTVNPVRPESLPPFAVALRACVSDTSHEDTFTAISVDKRKKMIRVAGSPSVNDLYFKAATTLATSLAGGERIAVINPGVSIQSGGNTRSGDSFPSDPRRANRKEYLRKASSTSSGTADESYIESPTNGQLTNSINAGSSFFDVSDTLHEPSGKSSSAFKVPDMNIFEGARKLSERDAPSQDEGTALYGGLSTASVGSSSTIRIPSKATEKQKRNISLLSGGPSVIGSRDRVIPKGLLSPSERMKLPAPPIGHTTGHGLHVQVGNITKGVVSGLSRPFIGNMKSDKKVIKLIHREIT